MTYLAIIGLVYWTVGTTSLVCLTVIKVGRRGWPVPILKFRWDKHGLCDICVGSIYIVVDSLIYAGLYTH